ncbi:MAG: aldo/keto reductase [Aquidulcibacter sp.]|jgi:aryl-alcohol dehydrogenase-like predicted oxidoreductase
MDQRKFGKTGWRVSPISYGAMGIALDPDLNNGISPSLLLALEKGMTMIDTARIYPGSEEIIGKSLRAWKGEKPLISTKIAPLTAKTFRQFRPLASAFTPQSIRDSVEASLRALGVERVDVLHLHQWFYLWSFEPAWFDSLHKLQREGKIGAIAVSAQDHEHDALLEIIRSNMVDCIQFIFNIFESRPKVSVLPLAEKHGVATIGRCVLDSGGLSGTLTEAQFAQNLFLKHAPFSDYQKRLDALRTAYVGTHANSLGELAVRYALSDQRLSTITLGCPTRALVHANLQAAANGPLPQAIVDEITTYHVWTKNHYERLV